MEAAGELLLDKSVSVASGPIDVVCRKSSKMECVSQVESSEKCGFSEGW